MANWWEAAPLADNKAPETKSGNWYEAAPIKRVYITGKPPDDTGEKSAADYAKGAYKAMDAGVASGVAGLLGAPRMIGEGAMSGLASLTDLGRGMLGQEPMPTPERSTDPRFSTQDFANKIQQSMYGGEKPYEPQNTGEEYARTIGEFLPNTLLGPGGIGRKALQTILPAAASETAGQLTKGEASEPWARFAAALAGGAAAGGVGAALSPGNARAVIERSMPGVTPRNIDDAYALVRDAQRMGTPLSWPEAISQVAGRPVLTNLLRHLEASPQTEARIGEFFGQREPQIRRAAAQQIEQIQPGAPPPPSSVGPAVGQAALRTVEDTRNAINAATRPLYDAAGQHLVPRQVHAAMMGDPLFEQTVNTIRNDPARNALVRGASDRSISMYDAVAKELEQRAKNAAQPTNPDANQAIAAVTGGLGGDIKNLAVTAEQAATQGPSAYEAALARQTQMREEILNPQLRSPLGQLADKDLKTKKAIDVLFSKKPDAYSEPEITNAVREVAARSPRAASDLIRQYAANVFNWASSDLQTGPSQTIGAKFRQQIAGNEQQRRNLQAAIEAATPDGAQRWRGFNRFLDVMEATGTRQNVGSRTAYNTEIARNLSGGGTVAKIASDPLGFLKPVRETFEKWRYGRDLNQAATILTDPNSAGMLREFATVGPTSRRAAQLSLSLLKYANAVGNRSGDRGQ